MGQGKSKAAATRTCVTAGGMQARAITVTVRTMTDTVLEARVAPSETVGEVRAAIRYRTVHLFCGCASPFPSSLELGLPAARVALLYAGARLDNDAATLASKLVQDGSTLHLVLTRAG